MMREMGFMRKLARLYTFNVPFKKGAYRLAEASLRFGGEVPDRLLVKTADGREIVVNPSDIGYQFVYFLGDYEPSVSYFIRRAVCPGDVCIDLGANIGWFTTLLQQLVGASGAVHAFEPVPMTFELLAENVRRNVNSEIVHLNNFALGEEEGEIEMQIDEGVPLGHAYVANESADGANGIKAKISTLQNYLSEKGIDRVDFMKADIEGSELSVLRKADALFEQDVPPIFEIEMALDTSKRFGYFPNDLVSFIQKKRDYEFYTITEQNLKLTRIYGFEESSPGANVLCIPSECSVERRKRLGVV